MIYRFLSKVCVTCFLLAVVLFGGGCRGPRLTALSPAEVGVAGTATFEAPPARVYLSCEAALRAMGYRLAERDEAQGVLRTVPTQARTVPFPRDGRPYLRQYEVAITAAGDGAATVVATPVLRRGRRMAGIATEAQPVGTATVWTVDQERAEWRRLFRTLGEHLEAEPGGNPEPVPPGLAPVAGRPAGAPAPPTVPGAGRILPVTPQTVPGSEGTVPGSH